MSDYPCGEGESSYPCLVVRFLGKTEEEIKKEWTSLEIYDEVLSQEKWALMETVLEGIISRAEGGQVDAVEWLEKHGLIEWPGQYNPKISEWKSD